MVGREESHDHVALISLSWDTALVSFSLSRMSQVTVESILPRKAFLAETVERSTIGRLPLDHLSPDTEYAVIVKWQSGSREFRFRTLPAPQGPLLCSFAAVADPHISLKSENRKGRLFMESSAIFHNLVDEFNAAGLDFVLIAGDLTNMGTRQEYEAIAAILDRLTCPCFAVPGDHDIVDDGTSHWTRIFGPTSWHKDYKGLRLFGLDTSERVLGVDGRNLIESNWSDDNGVRIMVSHHQLFPDGYISHGREKGIADFSEQEELLKTLFRKPTLLYIGHQNIPARATMNNALQINLPQPLQFQCGYVLVQQYQNGFYHTFKPIRSAVLSDYSRRAANMAADDYGEPQWHETYRIGENMHTLNFLHSFKNE